MDCIKIAVVTRPSSGSAAVSHGTSSLVPPNVVEHYQILLKIRTVAETSITPNHWSFVSRVSRNKENPRSNYSIGGRRSCSRNSWTLPSANATRYKTVSAGFPVSPLAVSTRSWMTSPYRPWYASKSRSTVSEYRFVRDRRRERDLQRDRGNSQHRRETDLDIDAETGATEGR